MKSFAERALDTGITLSPAWVLLSHRLLKDGNKTRYSRHFEHLTSSGGLRCCCCSQIASYHLVLEQEVLPLISFLF